MTNIGFRNPIRSFVSRKGRMCDTHLQALKTAWPQFGLELSPVTAYYDWTSVFGREAPLILEIGFGMGSHLLQMAYSNPQNNYVGIEVHEPGVGRVIRQIDLMHLKNLRIFQQDAVPILERCFIDCCLNEVQLLFPDPWPKKKHHKRRLIQSPFVELIAAKLKTGGLFKLATDWEDYAEQMLATLEASPAFINCYGVGSFAPQLRAEKTKFEARGQRLGHQIYDLIYQKQ